MKVTIEIEVDHRSGFDSAAAEIEEKLKAIQLKRYLETLWISVEGPDGLSFAPDTGVRVTLKS